MRKQHKRKALHSRRFIQKYVLLLFCLVLVLSPFSSLGESAYAQGDANEAGKREATNEKAENEGNEIENHSDDSTDESADTGEIDSEEVPIDPSKQDESGDHEADPDNTLTSGEGSGESEKDDPTMKKDLNASPPVTALQNDPPNPTEDGFAWELVEHLDVITITGYEGTDTEITIPSEIAGKEVRYIGGRAFESSDVEKVTIPDTVTSIGVYAFWKSQLKEVDLPNGLTEIQHSVFSHAELTEVTIPNTVTSIGNYAFIANNLSEITIPASVQTIGNDAFKFNELEELHIPVTVTSVGDGAFQSNKLSKVTIRNPELTLGENVFNGNYTDPAELTIFGYTGSTAETYAQGKGHTFESLNEKVTQVHFLSALAVSHGTDEQDLSLPSSVEVNVEDQQGVTNTITVPIREWSSTDYDAEEHGTYTFTGELDLDPAVENPNDLKATINVNVSSYAWEDNANGVTITGYYGSNENINIPDQLDGKDVTIIGESAFKSKNLTSVTIPDSVKEIEREAFYRNNLTSITFPSSLETIGLWAFRYNKITNLTIPGHVKEIGQSSFGDNEIETITIENGVEKIKSFAFSGNKIKNASIPESVKSIESDMFYKNPLETITVADGNQHYESINNKGLYRIVGKILISGTTSGEIAAGTKIIRNGAFSGRGLTEITIPESVSTVSDEAFIYNELEKVVFENKVTEINSTALRQHPDLEKVVIYGYTDSTAHDFALGGNEQNKTLKFLPLEYEWTDDGTKVTITGYKSDETDITIPEEIAGMPVTSIDINAFAGKGLTSVTLPTSLKEIGPFAFGGNELTSITIPENVEFIGFSPFAANPLETIRVADGNIVLWDSDGKGLYTTEDNVGDILILGTQSGEIADDTVIIAEGAFFTIGVNGEIDIPNSVQYIGPWAFTNGEGIEKFNNISKVVIPDSVREIGKGAFFDVGLEELILHDGLEKIGSEAFSYNSLKSVEIPSSVEIIDTSAFYKNKIEQLVLHEGLKRIEEDAFDENSLTSLEIPSTVEYIGEQAFQNNNLEQLILHEGLEEIDYGAFNKNSLTKVEIPSSVNLIWSQAFSNNKLEEVIIRAKEIEFNSDPFDENHDNSADLTIYGYKDSDVETFADNEGYTFIPLPHQLPLNHAEPYDFDSEEVIEVVNSDGEIVGTIEMPEFDERSPLASARLLIRDVAEGDVTATGLEVAGQIVEILFVGWEYDYDPDKPNEEEILNDEIEGDFTLSLRVNDDATGEIAMYHEIGHDDWENVGGEIADGFITATVKEFSKYGVFAEVKEPEEPETPEEPTEPETPEKPEDPELDPCESQDPLATGCPEDQLKDDDEITVTIESNDNTTPKKGFLPSTATNTYSLILVGGILLLIGTTIIFIIHRRKKIVQE